MKHTIICLLSVLLLSCAGGANSHQNIPGSEHISADIVILKHHFYTSYFSRTKHIPVLLEYSLTGDMVTCGEHVSRKGKRFEPDPQLPDETSLQRDYTGSGYDRGHNMSAEDNACNEEGMEECFYFSNMFPQLHSFNAGTWEELERRERRVAHDYSNIKVFVGNQGQLGTIGEDHVVVPAYCWKVIYIPALSKYECYIFPNAEPHDRKVADYAIDLHDLETKAGITFNGDKAVFMAVSN